ncbi:MAG TPA: hypothetical protein VGO81_18330 [Solirubrobacteraceae bacterium]|nr:hypothetical protein [Solirubrobacteraceae bacterium]
MARPVDARARLPRHARHGDCAPNDPDATSDRLAQAAPDTVPSGAYVDELRAAHKPKRNLMKLINELQPGRASLTP